MSFVPGSVSFPRSQTERELHWSSDTATAGFPSAWNIITVIESLAGGIPIHSDRWQLQVLGPGVGTGMTRGKLVFVSSARRAGDVLDGLLDKNWAAGSMLTIQANVDGLPATLQVQLVP